MIKNWPLTLVYGLLILSAALNSGCSSLEHWKNSGFRVGPNYSLPCAPVEDQLIDYQSDPRISIDEPDIAIRWYAFNDPILNELIDETLSQNLTLKQAGTRICQARAVQGIAIGNLFPQAQQAVGSYQRIQNSRNVAIPAPIEKLDQFNLGVNAAW